jgi:hypothetical protein
VSPLAFVLFALSFMLIGAGALMVGQYAIREFVKWRAGNEWPGPVTYLEPPTRYVGPHPIYSRLAAEHPDVVRTLRRYRARQLSIRLNVSTESFTEAMRRAGEALLRINESFARKQYARGGYIDPRKRRP